ncbi:type I restriction endonuclease subunit R [Rufibacter glacialis]|uniref:Type I restriction enzyme endonuclease subunit n=1 Tax=Rufibacter glacialis TaxID=1259555 RepID=A0A5M8QIV1_9BACT|nr:type I restriction endonuclease subunit R [Rufibacter glacialis]KAA6434706.1 type I restriction endonuclease subunit R [Rufibacter glacialis]GGK71768.1 DEAD/DEAH box helicase [Rufibacter glacialis]
MNQLNEDNLVQAEAAKFFQEDLGWESVYAYKEEVLGPEGTLGRTSYKEVYLVRYLRQALQKLNPGLPFEAYEAAIRQITETRPGNKVNLHLNREKYNLFRNGVVVEYRTPSGEMKKPRLQVFDFTPANRNHFLVVRELWVSGTVYNRRPDIIGFVNGIPLLFIELKNVNKNIKNAYSDNFTDYKNTIPHLFDANAFVVISNAHEAKIGSVTGKYNHFHDWKRLEEESPGKVSLEVLLRGVCTKANFMDLLENFILFDDSKGKLAKIVARNHQFLGVNRAVHAVRNREQLQGKLGVFWHTQGSGKSYSMVFFSEKVRRKLTGNFTFLIVTDRLELDDQIYRTYAGSGLVDNDANPCRPGSGKHLQELFQADKPYLFSLVHLFNQDVTVENPYSTRSDIIVISDEAHRSQYGRLALNMRTALPYANYIGFTGTPLFKNDEITSRIFGEYVSTYDFQRAVDDGATVPLYYDSRGEKLQLNTTEVNEKIAEKLDELSADLTTDEEALLERELAREYHIITAKKRLDAIARDFVEHYTTQWESGKAMFVCIDKITTVRMYHLVQKYWEEKKQQLQQQREVSFNQEEMQQAKTLLDWMEQTQMAVVVSEEQNEIDRFRKWGLDIIEHRKLLKQGFETPDGKRLDLETAFKKDEHPFRVAFVCAMWLTGFDVPSLSTLYLDKPLKAHTLMQAIARANRVYEGKNNGLIVDYCGILKSLREALATFATGVPGGGETPIVDPVEPSPELLKDLAESIHMVRAFLLEKKFDLDSVYEKTAAFSQATAILNAKEAINYSEETRKRFEILAREVFKKFKACLTLQGVLDYRADHDAISVIYGSLQNDKEKADITDILIELHAIVDEAVDPIEFQAEDPNRKPYDISKIDFNKLKEEFANSKKRNTTVQNLKNYIEQKLAKMMRQNPLRNDFYKRYQEIIADYNNEKDRRTIEETFEHLMRFMQDLNEEDMRASREGLNQEHLALFDQLQKPNLSKSDRERIKKVAKDLLEALKINQTKYSRWREKEASQADVKTFIYNHLWDEVNGLPESFTPEEIQEKSNKLYGFIFDHYPTFGATVAA